MATLPPPPYEWGVGRLRARLHRPERALLTRTFQMVLGSLDDAQQELLLGIGGGAVGLTRFRSVLLKRTLRRAFESSDLAAIEHLARWERRLVSQGWLPPPPPDEGGEAYCRFFEQHLCGRFVECLRAMAAAPNARCRAGIAGGDDGLALPDPMCVVALPDPATAALLRWAAPTRAAARLSDAAPPAPPPAAAAILPDGVRGLLGERDFDDFCARSGAPAAALRHHLRSASCAALLRGAGSLSVPQLRAL
eukprot:gene18387-19186_t